MEIVIYSTSTCVPCHELTKWLEKQELPYTKRITDDDPDAMLDFMQVNDGHIGVPFTVITGPDGTVNKIGGFNVGEFKKVLQIK